MPRGISIPRRKTHRLSWWAVHNVAFADQIYIYHAAVTLSVVVVK